MTSEKQIEANRLNALARPYPHERDSARSIPGQALRHGLTGQVTVLNDEDRRAHADFCSRIIDGFQPATPIERQLAVLVAEDNWRLNRIRAIENNIFALGQTDDRQTISAGHPEIDSALADAVTFSTQTKQFELLTLYDQRINRSMQRNLSALRDLQAERKRQHEASLEEAQLLRQLNDMKNLPYEPAKDIPSRNGFVFSIGQIDHAIDRSRRLKEAREAAQVNWNPALCLKMAAAGHPEAA